MNVRIGGGVRPLATDQSTSIVLDDYARALIDTDVLPSDDLNAVFQGLFGEVGAIMSTAKKVKRDTKAYPGHTKAAEEEFGDALWYFATLCRRTQRSLSDVFRDANEILGPPSLLIASDIRGAGVSMIRDWTLHPGSSDESLFQLGRATSALLGSDPVNAGFDALLLDFAKAFLEAMSTTDLSLARVAHANLVKARGAFTEPDWARMPRFDQSDELDEQLPDEFEITIRQRANGKSYLSYRGVYIGDALTDNIAGKDHYRFHDVFHLANAAVLSWSPVFRALIKHKRKSTSADEEQDGGRAIVVEEGLVAWIFTRAKEVDFFLGQDRVPLSMLKTIQGFVTGYEVERCPLKAWERAILQGYEVFRAVRDNGGGVINGSRLTRSISYSKLPEQSV